MHCLYWPCLWPFYDSGSNQLASVTKSIEDLTDGYQKDEISVPDYHRNRAYYGCIQLRCLHVLKVLDESRSEFVSNVSHELKTPMTSMKVLADSLVGQEGVPEELYQEFMRDITAEIDRENRIITDLLTLVKMDKKSADLQISHMDINQLLEDILKRLRPIADKRNIDLILDSFRPVEADVDELKFTSAISNLVENAIKYNVDDGWVRVSLDADHKFFYVTVADSGMGIPEDSIDRIFREILSCGQITFQRDRRNRSWTCDNKKYDCHASWCDQSIQQRRGRNYILSSCPVYLIFRRRCRMKKYIRVLLLAALVCSLLAGCSIETKSSKDSQDESK